MDASLYASLRRLLDSGRYAEFESILSGSGAHSASVRGTLLTAPVGRRWNLLLQAVWHLHAGAVRAAVRATAGAVEGTVNDQGVLEALEQREKENGAAADYEGPSPFGAVAWELLWALLRHDRWTRPRGKALFVALVERLRSRGGSLAEYLTRRTDARWTLAQQAAGGALRTKDAWALNWLRAEAPRAFVQNRPLFKAVRATAARLAVSGEDAFAQRPHRLLSEAASQTLRSSPRLASDTRFPFLTDQGKWHLLGRSGAFHADARTGAVRSLEDGVQRAVVTRSTVVGRRPFQQLLSVALSDSTGRGSPRQALLAAGLSAGEVEVRSGEVMRDIRLAGVNAHVGRAATLFVLPSQLNGCEYPSHECVVDSVDDYRHDHTGGPRGQLACHPALAQALLDAAASDRRPHGFHGFAQASLPGWSIRNGYLKFPSFGPQAFDSLSSWASHVGHAVLAVAEEVSVAGLDERLQWTSPAPGNIALAYASAAPVCAYLNGCDSSSEKRAQTAASCLLVAAQYLAALQHAVESSSCRWAPERFRIRDGTWRWRSSGPWGS